QLSFLIGEAGFTPNSLDVSANVLFEDGSITSVTLDLTGDVPNIDEKTFNDVAQKAKEVCPISKLLDTTIKLNVKLK
ncbi:MAG: OsmC family protein, partial [Bacteroidia bacterium]|nr:OsmC family protein [Bacteroidia bacterium]